MWFSVHKWIGLLLALLIVPISFSGAALVWHDWLDEVLNPGRYAVTAGASLSGPDVYAEAAKNYIEPGERIATIRMPEHEGGPVMVSAALPPQPGAAPGGRPVRANLWLDPADGRLLDRARSDEGAVRFLHVLHGSLMVPGVGRQIVGWIGVAMLISSLTGLYLWWPRTGSWRRGLRWRRQATTSNNLHHQTGFWIVLPLAMLSFTGVWISFPAFFGPLSGAPAGGGPGRQGAARPIESPGLSVEAAFAAARPLAEGRLMAVNFPTDKAPEWKLSFERTGSPAEVVVADANGAVTPPKPARGEPIARTMRRWHDGTGMGQVWQTIIFLSGVIPLLLAVTGIIMWLNTRKWRGDVSQRRREGVEAAQPAE